MKRVLLVGAVVLATCGVEARAGFIDFESGFSDQQSINSPIDTGDNVVTISTTGGNPSGLSYIAGVGLPRTAFTTGSNNSIADDTAVDGRAGSFFLTDENTPGSNNYASNYVFNFVDGITELSLDIFDFRVDGGAQGTDENPINSATATLTLFADEAMTQIVGMTSFTATMENRPVDGNWENMLAIADGTAVKAVLDLGGLDRGVGVDNISFLTSSGGPTPPVPEPSSFVLLGLGAVGLIGYRRFKGKKQATA